MSDHITADAVRDLGAHRPHATARPLANLIRLLRRHYDRRTRARAPATPPAAPADKGER